MKWNSESSAENSHARVSQSSRADEKAALPAPVKPPGGAAAALSPA
ncbi:MAG: hypothetical protein ACLTDR_12760 [Adlercreutzia equolifaciens]